MSPSCLRQRRSGVNLCELCATFPPVTIDDMQPLCKTVSKVLSKATGVDFSSVLSYVRIHLASAAEMEDIVARRNIHRHPLGSAFGVCICQISETIPKSRLASIHIHLLRELPLWLAGSFLAHELIHALVFLVRPEELALRDADESSRLLEEGLCHLGSAVWLSHYSRRMQLLEERLDEGEAATGMGSSGNGGHDTDRQPSPVMTNAMDLPRDRSVRVPAQSDPFLLSRCPVSTDLHSVARQLPSLTPFLNRICSELRSLSLSGTGSSLKTTLTYTPKSALFTAAKGHATSLNAGDLVRMVRELQVDFWLKKLLLGKNPQFSVGLVRARSVAQQWGWKDALYLVANGTV